VGETLFGWQAGGFSIYKGHSAVIYPEYGFYYVLTYTTLQIGKRPTRSIVAIGEWACIIRPDLANDVEAI
jgi:hypothetical protein